jgi:hypothetical protein
MKKLLMLKAIILLMIGCAYGPAAYGYKTRAILEPAADGVNLEARVYLEGSESQNIDGAFVYVKSPGNELTVLNFDYNKGCYTAKLGNPMDGDYHVEIDSYAFGIESMHIPYSTMDQSFSISSIQDELGNEVLQGEILAVQQKIAVIWPLVESASVYKIILTDPDSNRIHLSTSDNSTVLQKDWFEVAGNYSLQVEAQYLAGDPFFSEYDYCAVNAVSTSRLYFQVQ